MYQLIARELAKRAALGAAAALGNHLMSDALDQSRASSAPASSNTKHTLTAPDGSVYRVEVRLQPISRPEPADDDSSLLGGL